MFPALFVAVILGLSFSGTDGFICEYGKLSDYAVNNGPSLNRSVIESLEAQPVEFKIVGLVVIKVKTLYVQITRVSYYYWGYGFYDLVIYYDIYFEIEIYFLNRRIAIIRGHVQIKVKIRVWRVEFSRVGYDFVADGAYLSKNGYLGIITEDSTLLSEENYCFLELQFLSFLNDKIQEPCVKWVNIWNSVKDPGTCYLEKS